MTRWSLDRFAAPRPHSVIWISQAPRWRRDGGSDEAFSQTRVAIGRSGKEPETRDLPQVNHIGMNIESFARAALGQGAYQIDDAGILQTVAALDAVFRSAEADGAWQSVG